MAENITIKVDATSVVARFGRIPDEVRQEVKRAVTRQTLSLERLVKDKLSDDVLHVRTGRLRRSIFSRITEETESISGRVASSADVPYARIHEYGGVIHHPGGTAYWKDKDGSLRFVSNATANQAQSNFARTRPHNITIPERSYMRSSLRERADPIKTDLVDAVKAGTK